MVQVWETLLFAHWPLPPRTLAPLIPPGLDLHCHEGQAWLGIVPFEITRLCGAWEPVRRVALRFPELNVRTYVTCRGEKPGVYFFSLDAASLLAVLGARLFYLLPYYPARMAIAPTSHGIYFCSRRMWPFSKRQVQFKGTYKPVGEVFEPRPGTLEHFLTERYALYTHDPAGHLWRCEIHHPPWPLQVAQAVIEQNTMASGQKIGALPKGDPLLHYAHRQEVLVWPLQRVQSRG